jgi:uncharacterized membrane-anchored protein
MNKLRVALVAVAQLALVGLAVYPQLSTRATGEEYRLEVGLLDPIDPQRGAYVDLAYPALQHEDAEGEEGDVFVVLEQDGDVWTSEAFTRDRPDDGPYLACHSTYWQLRCGIESWYLPQDEAERLGNALRTRDGVATIRVDARGRAAIVDLDLVSPPPPQG